MKKIILAVIVLAAFAAACRERKAEPRLDYDGSRANSERSQKSLDNEVRGE